MPFADYQARMDAAAQAEARAWVPRPHEGTPVFDHAGLTPLETYLTGQQRPVFLMIFGAVAVLVVLGCVNVSGLMASRVQDRGRELAVRRALGAGSRQIASMLLTESLVIVGAGTLVGVALARPLMALTMRLLPDAMGLLKPPSIDLRVMTFAGLASLVAALLVSIWPIWRSVRASLSYAMSDGSQPTTRVRSTGRMLVVSLQVALGLTLALGGALLVGSLVRVWQTDPGFRTDKLLVLQARTPSGSTQVQARAIEAFLTTVRRVPGAAVAGATQSPILTGGSFMNAFADGATVAVTPGFFEATGLTLLDGRWLTPEEIASGAAVAVVSERVARRVGKGERVIGREIRGFVEMAPRPFTVVGVVADAHFGSWDRDGSGQIYGSYVLTATNQNVVTVVVQTGARPGAVLASLLPMIKNTAGDVQVTSVASAADLLDESIRQRRLESWLFGSFAVAALAIVDVGVFGLMAMTTARRTREIGVRMALGASSHAVVALLMREQLVAVVVGLGAGALVSRWAVSFVTTYLYQLTGYDRRVWGIAVALIVATAALGALVPALRASRLNPVAALRVD
jgi:putative ABC transport system permease protein